MVTAHWRKAPPSRIQTSDYKNNGTTPFLAQIIMIKLIKSLIPKAIKDYVKYAIAKLYLKSSYAAARAIGNVDSGWRARIDDVISSPDNAEIERCATAGELDGYTITMHNGVRVCANGYYGAGILNLLVENRGVHEPQEERAFEQIIRLLPNECVMLELGAYWGFYSLSLLQQRSKAKCFLVEPSSANLFSGKLNFRLNKRQGDFTQAYVDRSPKEYPKTISVDSFCKEHKIEHLNLLHSDIQGYELSMLEGATSLLTKGDVDFVFISTHSPELHSDCITKLKSFGYIILADADMNETFSLDGLIVAKHQSVEEPQAIEISKKKAHQDGATGRGYLKWST